MPETKGGAMEEVLTEPDPNYDCRKTGKCPMCGENHAEVSARERAAQAVADEHTRLEKAVIEKVKAWRSVNAIDRPKHNYDVIKAVDALNEFESNQLKVKK